MRIIYKVLIIIFISLTMTSCFVQDHFYQSEHDDNISMLSIDFGLLAFDEQKIQKVTDKWKLILPESEYFWARTGDKNFTIIKRSALND